MFDSSPCPSSLSLIVVIVDVVEWNLMDGSVFFLVFARHRQSFLNYYCRRHQHKVISSLFSFCCCLILLFGQKSRLHIDWGSHLDTNPERIYRSRCAVPRYPYASLWSRSDRRLGVVYSRQVINRDLHTRDHSPTAALSGQFILSLPTKFMNPFISRWVYSCFAALIVTFLSVSFAATTWPIPV